MPIVEKPVEKPTVFPPLFLGACQLEKAWSVRAPPLYMRRTLTVAPSGGLLSLEGNFSGNFFFRTRDGHQLGFDTPDAWGGVFRNGVLGSGWGFTVRHDGKLWLEDDATGSRRELLPLVPSAGGEVSERSEGFADDVNNQSMLLTCRSDAHRLLNAHFTWSRIDGSAPKQIDLGVPCTSMFNFNRRFKVSSDGRWAAIAPVDDGTLAVVDLHEGTVAISRNWLQTVPPVLTRTFANIYDFAVENGQVAVTGGDRLLHVFDAKTMEESQAPWPIGVAETNPLTFQPSDESPVSFNPDGTLLAFRDVSGKLAVREISTGRTVFELEAGTNGPVAVLLEHNAVNVNSEDSLDRWVCQGAPKFEGREVTVRVEGPMRVSNTSPLSSLYKVDAQGVSPIAVRSLLFKGYSLAADFRPELNVGWQGMEVGPRTLKAIVDDGVNFGSTTLDVEVVP